MLFPWGLPFPTAFYLLLFVLTFALSQAFMHYVLAGSLYVAWTIVFPGSKESGIPRCEQPLAAVLRDWMPFLLSAAITAGVAPLLFIQIVYQRQFYTANLLLFWRWMAVVPILIVAFYLLYLVKSSIMNSWPRAVRASIAVLTAGCFVFVGFCWTVNYLLGIHELRWPEVYVTGQMPFATSTLISRMLMWIGGSFASMSAIAVWQLWYLQSRIQAVEPSENELPKEFRRLAGMSFGGLLVFVVAGFEALAESNSTTRSLVVGSLEVTPYLLVALIGMLIQVHGWWGLVRSRKLQVGPLREVSCGAILALLGISFVREAVRTSSLDLASQFQKHAEAAKVGGFVVFLIFAVLVTATIVWCIRIVRAGLSQTETQSRLSSSVEAGE